VKPSFWNAFLAFLSCSSVCCSADSHESGVGEGAAAAGDLGLHAVQDDVDAGDGVGGPVHLLAEVAQLVGAMAALAQVVGGVDEQAAGAAGRVVDRLAGDRLEDADEDVHHLRRREELAGLGAGVVGELLDEVLVGAAEDVRLHVGVGQRDAVEVLDESADDLVGDELALAVGGRLVPFDGEDAGQLLVGGRDAARRLGQLLADVLGHLQNVGPVAAVGDGEAVDVLAGAEGGLLPVGEGASGLALQLGDLLLDLVVPLVGQALEEHE
jgi:hypothetical protein